MVNNHQRNFSTPDQMNIIKVPPLSSIGVPCVVPVSELYTVRCRTVFVTNALSGLCHIRYRIFPVKTPAFVLTVQWVANLLCTYMLYCVPYNLFTRILIFQNDQLCTQLVVYVSFRRRSVSDLTSHN
jgi:hypothetical protein